VKSNSYTGGGEGKLQETGRLGHPSKCGFNRRAVVELVPTATWRGRSFQGGVAELERLFPTYKGGLDPHAIYDDLELPGAPADRPFIGINMVTSVDGKTTVDGEHRTVKLGSAVDRALMGRIRAHFDAVLRGAETVRANPHFPTDELSGSERMPVGVVVSRSLDLPLESEYFTKQGARRIVLTCEASDPLAREQVSERADVLVCGKERVDLGRAMKVLRLEYGIDRLLVEGGASLNYWFVEAGLVDTLFWTLAPKLIGYKGDLSMIEGPEAFTPPAALRLASLFHHCDELFFRWALA